MRLRPTRSFVVEPPLPERLRPLLTLAQNLFWTWNTDVRALFARIDSHRWEECGHNPVQLLQGTTAAEFERLAQDDAFYGHMDSAHEALRAYLDHPPAFAVDGLEPAEVIAYFSLEFALTESLPNYSGGLGVLAGDHLKSASDLGLPLIALGLFYHEGYFHQELAEDGWQQEEYDPIDPDSQPVRLLRDDDGRPLTVNVPFPGREVAAALWRMDVGRTTLILLDANVTENEPADRKISARLYGGDFELRIKQEMLLGIGGVRALDVLNLRAAVCHMNEGHSALLGLERIRMLMKESGASFDEARLPVAAATVFTTHTAVAAGIDLFSPDLVEHYLGGYYGEIGLDSKTFLGLGRIDPEDAHEPFSMALLGLRLSGFRNGVSRLHRTVSQELWEEAWPGVPTSEAPIKAITNGVHLPTWVSHELGTLYDGALGATWRRSPESTEVWSGVHGLNDGDLWATHERQRRVLIERVRGQARRTALTSPGVYSDRGKPLSFDTLTIGFARRFAAYKRATLLFRDPGRLAGILNHPERPIQFVFAGKAHPRDDGAKQLIREVLHFSRLPEFRDRLVLLDRYDVDLARAMVQGCDVWLNTPLRPLEASGTSGMKAVANGALHCSVLDGWWHEAFRPGAGWAIGRDAVASDPDAQDALDAESLYELLEEEIGPLFYSRDAMGVPGQWVAQMKQSIAAYAPVFNTGRMVAEYASQAYAPAAKRWHHLHDDNLQAARGQAAWRAHIRACWGSVGFRAVDDDIAPAGPTNGHVSVNVRAALGELSAEDVRVDVLYGRKESDGSLVGPAATRLLPGGRGEDGNWSFSGRFTPDRGGPAGYSVRILPDHPELHDPFSMGLVCWDGGGHA